MFRTVVASGGLPFRHRWITALRNPQRQGDSGLSTKYYSSLVFTEESDLNRAGQPDFGQAKPFKDIPGPRGLPYIGTLFQYTRGPFSVRKFHGALQDRYEEYGKIFKETIAGKTTVHVFDPEDVRPIYQQEGKMPAIPPLLETTQRYRKYRDMSPGLGNTNGEEWYKLRSSVQQMMMRPKAVSMYLPALNQVVSDVVARWGKIRNSTTGEVPELQNEISKWILESAATICIDKRLGSLEAEPGSLPQNMIDASATIFELSLKLHFSLPWYKHLPHPTWKKLVQTEDLAARYTRQLVEEALDKIKHLTESGKLEDGQYKFLTYLLGQKNLLYKDVITISLSLFTDGIGTTSPTMAGQLYCLAKNPEKQEQLYEEVCRVAPDPDQPITAEMIQRASYLKGCIKEGFRFFPIGTEVSRLLDRDMVICGYKVPAGTHVELNQNMLLRHPKYFKKPDSYLPERWERGGSAEKVHPFLLLPFSTGVRTCAGKRFAEQDMNMMIMKLLQHFRLEWPHQDEMGQTYKILLRPDIPARIKFIPRM